MENKKIIVSDTDKVKTNIRKDFKILCSFKVKDCEIYCSLVENNLMHYILIEDCNEDGGWAIRINATDREDGDRRFFALSSVFDVENNEINIF